MKTETLRTTLSLVMTGQILDFNLADVSLDGKRLFEMGEVKRSDMPQLKGFPMKGSVAALLEVDKKGKVDVTLQFLDWLKREHKVQIISDKWSTKQFKGSQSELVASKIAHHVPKLQYDGKHKKFSQLYITDGEGTLIDSHHAWASIHVLGILQKQDYKLQVRRVMMPIDKLLQLARDFTSAIGISPKEGL